MNVRPLLVVLIVLFALAWVRAAPAAEPPDLVRGEHLATAVTRCTDCHRADFRGGRSFPAGPDGASVTASNLTAGAGGVGRTYSDADYVRAIRQGVRPDGTRLSVMPSPDYAFMTDADVKDLVAYLRSLPPVDREIPKPQLGATGAPPGENGAAASAPETNGEYLARLGSCFHCHGADLRGTTLPGIGGPDISARGIGTWSATDFTAAMRAGRTPAGRTLSNVMPWRAIGRLTDGELRALYDYLESAPASGAK